MSYKSYGQAINDAHALLLERDKRFFVMGQGVDSPWFVGKTIIGLTKRFGYERIIDTPICEAAMTGAAIGAAMAGMRPVVFYPRMDFMYLALDQIVNHCSNWSYMFNGKVNVPMIIRGIVNRGGEQSTQHSQSPISLYAHIPGLKVVCPATAYDAKGLFISAYEDDGPVIFIDDHWLYDNVGEVPDEYYTVSIGKAKVVKQGKDVTVIALSYLVPEALKAASELKNKGVRVEVIDIRSVKPLDVDTIIESVLKTGLAVVACGDWEFCGLAAYISSIIYQKLFKLLKREIVQIAFPNIHIPASTPLEKAFFPKAQEIIKAVDTVIK